MLRGKGPTDHSQGSGLEEGHSDVGSEPHQDQQDIHVLPQLASFGLVLKRAANTFSHLKKAISNRESPESLSYQVKINFFDFDAQGLLCDPIELPFDELSHIPSGVRQILIVVEDLSKQNIFGLGDHFGISPEFFEEHLLNSGYGFTEEHYNDPPSTTWPTAHLTKSHKSIKWYRPVKILPTPFSNHNRSRMLKRV